MYEQTLRPIMPSFYVACAENTYKSESYLE